MHGLPYKLHLEDHTVSMHPLQALQTNNLSIAMYSLAPLQAGAYVCAHNTHTHLLIIQIIHVQAAGYKIALLMETSNCSNEIGKINM